MKILFLALALVLGVAAYTNAHTCDDNGCTFFAEYQEPTTYSNGLGQLDNLTGCMLNYTVSVNGGAPGPVKTRFFPALTPTGGTWTWHPVTDTELVPGNDYTLVGEVICENPFGQSAPPTRSAPKLISRRTVIQLPPAPPAILNLQ